WRNDMKASTSLVRLSDLNKYYTTEDFHPANNRIIQAHFNIGYQLTSNWSVSYGEGIDLSKKIRPLHRTIKVTYIKDCVSIAIQLYDDYTFDKNRGIKKVHSKSASVRLKIINM
ncbi:MAG: hypothetical protein ACRYE9_00490, partial [Janthinobacterium lividum]